MKKITAVLLAALLLSGCNSPSVPNISPSEIITENTQATGSSRFDMVTEIMLSDSGIRVNGGGETDAVFATGDIIYYEDRETYDSGNPYGEGTAEERHSAEEAAAHTVVNITQPGAYRVTGKLSKGQIRVDLGEDAEEDPNAVVELILADADITCTVAPAILFQNVYACDEDASEETATADVDTSSAGANLILEGKNTINGSHVAKIFKDKGGEKKLWKQDAAIYSYMSMNMDGPGILTLTADNEGLGSEMHLTINGGNISIEAQNDGINTNEDGVSVTTINGGSIGISAGLGAEGDCIDSNGYLVINDGHIIAFANPKSDGGLDSDLGTFIHGGSVVAMGSGMNSIAADSQQSTMILHFATPQSPRSEIILTRQDGTVVFSFEADNAYDRPYSTLILASAALEQGETYHVSVNGVPMGYTGNDAGRGPGGKMPGDARPEGIEPPKDFDPNRMEGRGPRPDDMPPETFDGQEPPKMPEGSFGGRGTPASGEKRTDFYMNDKVNVFSGVIAAE